MASVPKPGEIIHVDFKRSVPARDTVRLVQWNIERGLQLRRIVERLRQLDADIVCLQEVDIGCERSGGVDVGRAIAEELQYEYLFICEFEEKWSPVRDASSQGGGVHGNAILSRFNISSWTIIEHSHHPVDWNDQQHPRVRKEPRAGRRLSLAADIATPLGSIRVYNCHLEVFCGMLSRMRQFADVLRNAKHVAPQQQQQHTPLLTGTAAQQQQQQQQQQQHMPDGLDSEAQPAASAAAAAAVPPAVTGPSVPMQAILGDLNTMAHGIARLSPDYCCDALRWRSLGCSEAAYWQRHLLSYLMPASRPLQAPDTAAAAAGDAGAGPEEQLQLLRPYLSPQLLRLGLPEEVCADLLNPGFMDPFDVDADATLDNPKYKLLGVSLMKGKLDWVLLRGLQVVHKAIGNHDYAASDHKWLMVDVRAPVGQQLHLSGSFEM